MGINDSISAAMRKDTPVVNLDDTMQAAIRKMADGGVTALLVKADNQLVGIVTEMDIMHRLVNGADPSVEKVRNIMTACELITSKPARVPCVQLDESETIKNALAIMHEAGIRNLLIAGPDGQVKGVVSAGELLKRVII